MTARALAPLLLASLLAAGCAPRTHFDPGLVDVPIAGRPWVSPEGVHHPLVGKIYAPRAGRFTDEAALDAALGAADFVLLGEVHDNADAHLLQARLLRTVLATGRRPALAFEMLDAEKQEAVDRSLASAPHDPDALASAVKWSATTWPSFTYYRPIFVAGLDAGLPIVAANLKRTEARAIMVKGREALDPDLAARLARDEPVPVGIERSLRQEMKDAHCGEIDDAVLDPFVLAQRARDARLSERMATVGRERGAVLIAGKGHARDDRGVPRWLAKDAPGRKVVTVAFVEVEDAQVDPASYKEEGLEGRAPFDFLVFTPRIPRSDLCSGMKAKIEAARKAQAKDAKGAGMEPSGASSTAHPDLEPSGAGTTSR
jgi:uncharacterized iron-regulated protein